MPYPALPPKSDLVETFHGVAVPDPYRTLEEMDAPATKAWVEAQNAHLATFLAAQADLIAATTKDLSGVMDYPRQSAPSHHGRYWTRSYNPGLAPQPIIQIADAPTGPWRTLLDTHAIDPSGNTSLSGLFFTEDGSLTAYTLSVGGGDETTLYVMETATGAQIDQINDCRFTGVTWDLDNKGFHYTYPASANETRLVLKHHVLGRDAAADPVIFQHEHPQSNVGFGRYRDSGMEVVSVEIGTDSRSLIFWRLSGESDFKQLTAEMEFIAPVELIDGKIYAVSKARSPQGELITIDPTTGARTTIIPARTDAVLESASLTAGRLLLAYSYDAADEVMLADLDGTIVGKMDLPVQSTISFSSDNKDDSGCYVTVSSYVTPGTQYWYDYASNQLTHFADSACPITLADCIVERVRATSKDGTAVPMTIIRHPDTKLDGTAAVKLYGYGGFDVSLTPAFAPLTIASWIKAGGIYARANLRGGGEFGTQWGEDGKKHKKQNVFDDFIACAEKLIADHYTSPARLVIEGGSNGGLLTLACMLQRPDLYGAVLSHVPVADMLRFDLHTYGAYWKSDYGDPKADAADFKVSMAYSPLHNVKAGQLYPPHLVLTGDHDTRVAPLHSYKFVATMQEKADPQTLSFLRVEMDAGHGAGTSLQKSLDEAATIMGFCAATIGPINQTAYKAEAGLAA